MTNLISVSKLRRFFNVKLQHNTLSPKSLLVLLAALLLSGACGSAPDQCTEAAVKAEEEPVATTGATVDQVPTSNVGRSSNT